MTDLPNTLPDPLTAARAEALFGSDLSTDTEPPRAEITAAIRRSIHLYGGTHGCATHLACAFGERPETAVPRMRWALRLVRAAYPRGPLAAGRDADLG